VTGQLDEAIAEFEEAARLAPRDPRARYDLGIAQLRAGRAAAAERSLRDAVRLEPDNAYSRIALGSALSTLGRSDEARAEAEHALRLAPDDRSIRAEARRIAR
jgi:Flp pilus assembly protein TadD